MAIHRITNAQKLTYISQARQSLANGVSIRAICRDFGIQPQQLRSWLRKENLILASKRSHKGVYCRRGGCLKDIEEPLIEWFLSVREIGCPVDIRMMVIKAGTMDPVFAQKPWNSKYQVMQRFLKANCISIRAGTRISQRNPQEMFDDALAFVQFMHGRLLAPDVH